MVSTQTYDLLILVGVIVLIAVIIFWSVKYGAAIVSDVMLESPIVLQNTFSSYASIAGMTDGNVYIKHKIIKGYPLYAFMNSSYVHIKPVSAKYYPFTETERGGYIGFGIRPPVAFVNLNVDVVRKLIKFYPNLHVAIILNKTDNKVQIGVE